MTLLQQIARQRFEKRERARVESRKQLHQVLSRILPGRRVYIFGSVLKPGRFTENSDIDVALESEPTGTSVYQLISILGESIGRRVDVVLLDECRFKDKILKEGEAWTLPA